MGKLGNWLQVGANVGILVGLAMVWLQMKQNSELMEYQLLSDETASASAALWAAAGEQYADV